MTRKQCLAEGDCENGVMIDRYEEALQRIDTWSRAYPLDIFPEPDFDRVRAALEGSGISLDAISASCMRHVVEGVGKIAREALVLDQ